MGIDGAGGFGGFNWMPEVGAPTAAELGATAAIPDVASVAGDPSLRYEALNRQITTGYTALAKDFQAIVDPGFARTGSSAVDPVWFAFAPTASRQAGLGMVEAGAAAGDARAVDAALGPIGPILHALAGRTVPLLGDAAGALAPVLARLGGGRLAGDSIAAKRLADLVASAPGRDAAAQVACVAQTLRNALEDGNRRIYGDVGAAGEAYLRWRQGLEAPPTPAEVLSDFRVPGSTGPSRAAEIYQFAHDAASPAPAQPPDLAARFPSPPCDTRDMVVAAFALYEEAGTSRDPARRNDLVAMGNVLTAYREQHDAVAPAFDPGRVLPGEVDRKKLFQLMTPSVALPLRAGGGWTFASYAARKLPSANAANWADFSTRWPAILDAFSSAYRAPAAMWPLPPADPLAPAR